MPVSTVFFLLTGMCIFAWIVIFSIAATDGDDPPRIDGFYSWMIAAIGIAYTLMNMLIQVLVVFS